MTWFSYDANLVFVFYGYICQKENSVKSGCHFWAYKGGPVNLQKISKKLACQFWEKCVTNVQTDRKTVES